MIDERGLPIDDKCVRVAISVGNWPIVWYLLSKYRLPDTIPSNYTIIFPVELEDLKMLYQLYSDKFDKVLASIITKDNLYGGVNDDPSCIHYIHQIGHIDDLVKILSWKQFLELDNIRCLATMYMIPEVGLYRINNNIYRDEKFLIELTAEQLERFHYYIQ